MGQKITALLLAIWLGTQLSSGYLVAPVLFNTLPKIQAGDIAGQIFHLVSYLGVVALLALVLNLKYVYNRLFLKNNKTRLALFVLFLIAINEWLVTPVIVALKTGQSHWLALLLSNNFGVWHGISSSIYLLVSILGLVLFVMVTQLQLGRRY